FQLTQVIADIRARHLQPARRFAQVARVQDFDQQCQRFRVHSEAIVKFSWTQCQLLMPLSRLTFSSILTWVPQFLHDSPTACIPETLLSWLSTLRTAPLHRSGTTTCWFLPSTVRRSMPSAPMCGAGWPTPYAPRSPTRACGPSC